MVERVWFCNLSACDSGKDGWRYKIIGAHDYNNEVAYQRKTAAMAACANSAKKLIAGDVRSLEILEA